MEFVAFDIETTGFLPRVDNIVEIAAVRFQEGKPVGSFSTLVNPNRPMPPAASQVNGITDEMLVGQPHVESALEGFAEFCGSSVLVAHNAPFDMEFIKADVEKLELAAPSGVILDSCAIARRVVQGAPNYKLGTLVQFFKIPVDAGFHRAEADSRFCGLVFQKILERIFRPGESVILENLVNLSGPQPLKFPQIVKSQKQLDFLSLV